MQPVGLKNPFCLLAVPECPVGEIDLYLVSDGIFDERKKVRINGCRRKGLERVDLGQLARQ